MYELWRETDAELVAQETDEVREFYAWVESLPVDDAHAAIQGLVEYTEAVQAERDIRQGHLRYED